MQVMLCLYRVIGYNGAEPIAGARIKAFVGNKKKCTSDAKKWLQNNPAVAGVINPIWKWEAVPK